ncbi:MAG: phosphoglucosamine mutase [Thermodesulfobacteriota bacterium]
MEKLFGTDGIRGRANKFPIKPEVLMNIAKAAAAYFYESGDIKNKLVIIAKDTRASCDMIEAALTAGFSSMGIDIDSAGILPTPGLSYAVSNSNADFGVMISASHNPYYDNGIKFFKSNGEKLTDIHQEKITEKYYENKYSEDFEPGIKKEAHEKYFDIYKKLFVSYSKSEKLLKDQKIILDTANGACSESAPAVFRQLGADIQVINDKPDGYNINKDCGSEHTEMLSQKVVEEKADFGLSFDGDGDRLIAVDENGDKLTGDQILAIAADFFNKNKIVATVMSNLGLKKFCEKRNISLEETKVGDRYVYEAMKNENSDIGGEDSGHLIFLKYQNTGDGILSGVILADIINQTGKKLSELKKIIKIYPQKLVNYKVKEKTPLEEIPQIQNAVKTVEERLDTKGRVLVRYSGTQNMCRVMCEAETDELADEACRFIGKAVTRTIGV